ncbi:MAG: response regulator [Planctomycetes bacterium]|nr:response regulator [Planctomycetota bacterium]
MKDGIPLVMVLHSDVDLLPRLYRLLLESGCRVATYSSPWAARDFAESERPDAILTSVGFPGLEELAVVHLLREASPASHIIALTPPASWASAEDAFASGADAVWTGSPPFESAIRVLRDALEARCAATPG